LAFLDSSADQQTVLVVRGASIAGNRPPAQPKKGMAWPLAWQTAKVAPPADKE
jgi:hypothetical protein